MSIRPFEHRDLDPIVEIDRKILGTRRQDYWEKRIETPIRPSPCSCLVAEWEGKVVGFILGEVSGETFCFSDSTGWISTIGVDPSYQRRGIARKLIQEYLKHLKSSGISSVYTFVNWNDWDLLTFFRAMGFNRGGDMINLELELKA